MKKKSVKTKTFVPKLHILKDSFGKLSISLKMSTYDETVLVGEMNGIGMQVKAFNLSKFDVERLSDIFNALRGK